MYQSRRWGKKKMKEEIETLQLAALTLRDRLVSLENTVNTLTDQTRAMKEELLILSVKKRRG